MYSSYAPAFPDHKHSSSWKQNQLFLTLRSALLAIACPGLRSAPLSFNISSSWICHSGQVFLIPGSTFPELKISYFWPQIQFFQTSLPDFTFSWPQAWPQTLPDLKVSSVLRQHQLFVTQSSCLLDPKLSPSWPQAEFIMTRWWTLPDPKLHSLWPQAQFFLI